MHTIELTAHYGHETARVSLSRMQDNRSYHMNVANYHWGAFIKYSTGWEFYGNAPSEAELTTADREILIDLILKDLEQYPDHPANLPDPELWAKPKTT